MKKWTMTPLTLILDILLLMEVAVLYTNMHGKKSQKVLDFSILAQILFRKKILWMMSCHSNFEGEIFLYLKIKWNS